MSSANGDWAEVRAATPASRMVKNTSGASTEKRFRAMSGLRKGPKGTRLRQPWHAAIRSGVERAAYHGGFADWPRASRVGPGGRGKQKPSP